MTHKLLIIYPHWPPSNLAGMHRARLIANFLPDFGWEAHVITVDPQYYEEELDWELCSLVNPKTKVYHVDAKPVNSQKRFVGDIALRAYKQLKQKALEVIRDEQPDFLWVPVPSYYTAIIARKVHDKTGIPYGIDYIDPWVDGFTNAEKVLSKDWMSNQLAMFLEPYSVKKAVLISGVAKGYYQPVLERNFENKHVEDVAMPYGFDPNDHKMKLDNIKYPWSLDEISVVYAGAFLPKSRLFITKMFSALKALKSEGVLDKTVKFLFLGTGSYDGKSISDYAEENGVAEHVVEVRERFPYLHILNFLSAASGVMVIGSTESHYTASKTYQSILSKSPILGCLHKESTAVGILRASNVDQFTVQFDPQQNNTDLSHKFYVVVKSYLQYLVNPDFEWKPNLNELNRFSSERSTEKLVTAIERCLTEQKDYNNA